jgi:hypothetical protein
MKRYANLFTEGFPETKKELDELLYTKEIPEYFKQFKMTVNGIFKVREALVDVLEHAKDEADKKKVQAKIDNIDSNLEAYSKKLSDFRG